MKKLFWRYLVPSGAISLFIAALFFGCVYAARDYSREESIAKQGAVIAQNTFWHQVNDSTLNSDSAIKGLADDLKLQPTDSGTMPSRYRYARRVELDQAKFQKLPVIIKRYIWQSDIKLSRYTVTEQFAADFKAYRNAGLGAVIKPVPPIVYPNPLDEAIPVFFWAFIAISTVGYAIVRIGHQYEYNEQVKLVEQVKPWWLAGQLIVAPVPGACLVLAGIYVCGHSLVTASRQSYKQNQWLKNHAFRSEIKQTNAVLKDLDRLPSTPEVSDLRNRAVAALESLRNSPETAQHQVARQLQKETEIAQKLSGLRVIVENVEATALDELKNREAVIAAQGEAAELGVKIQHIG